MKTITTEQFNALPEERRKYWKETGSDLIVNPHSTGLFDLFILKKTYTPIQINLEDAERVLEEAMHEIEASRHNDTLGEFDVGYNYSIDRNIFLLTTALNNLKQLTK